MAEITNNLPLDISISVTEDRRRATIRIQSGGSETHIVAADTASVDALITSLGNTRHQMLDPIPNDMADGVHSLAEFNPRWYVVPNTENQYATFWIRHPSFGWSGYGFPRFEAGKIAKWLRKVTALTATRDTHSPSATSFGDDRFLVTTEGLGFYYYGVGETRIGPNPFEQVEFDSDRAAGIVAGSIAEKRLEQALRSRLRTDQRNIAQNLFRPSGALGPFSVKIDLAYLNGLLSDEAYKDLLNLKNIRNDFAHDLDLDTFDVPTVRDRCGNFLLVDRHVGPVPEQEGLQALTDRPNPYMGLPNHEEKLSDPRFRYMMTAQLISNALGEAADNHGRPLPFV
ncbi:MAG: hypothetical protein WC048_12135 [Rhizobium sp.]